MPVQYFLQTIERLGSFSLGSRIGRLVLLLVVLASFGIGFTYHTLSMQQGSTLPLLFQVLQSLSTLLGFFALWLLCAQQFRSRQASPARIFWTVLLFSLLFITAAGFITSFSRIGDADLQDFFKPEYEYNNGVPRVMATIVRSTLLSFIGISFAFYLVYRIRALVLFKRTKTSQRNWNLLLGTMVAASLTFFLKSPQGSPDLPQIFALLAAVGFMVINALRASWIVYLNFKEKIISIALSLSLLVFLFIALGKTAITPPTPFLADMLTYIQFYNYVLYIFVMLSIGFGVLYCTASLLLLLFHLPTTGDFQRKTSERAVMHSLTELVTQAFDSEKLYEKIASSPVEAGSAEASWLAVADLHSGSLQPQIVATCRLTSGRVNRLVDFASIYHEVSGLRAPVVLRDASTDHRFNVRPGDGFGSLIALPLIARDEILGVLFVIKDVMHGFEQDDIDAIQVYAAQAAIAMDNARLFAEQIEKERLAQELDIAREVQRKLLPQRVPELDGITLAASNVSAERVGGDYYDFHQLDDQRLSLIIGDVSGKGASAAFYMAEMQGVFQSVSRLAPDPVDFLKHANAALVSSLDKNVFISVIYGLLDLSKEEFVIGRAGHCPAAMINLNGAARYVRPAGLGLGLDRGQLFNKTLKEERISLQPGDVFVLYTDGIIESRNEEGEEYGYERLLEALQNYRHEDANGIHSALLNDLNTFLGHKHYDDDMTLVVIKWHGVHIPSAKQKDNKQLSVSAAPQHST